MRNKKILVICPYPEGVAAGQRLKYEQYFDSWTKNGYEITISSFFSKNSWNILWENGHITRKVVSTFLGYLKRLKDLKRLHNFECIYVFMWVTPLFDSLFERLFLRRAKKLIYDFDDSIHIDSRSSDTSFFRRYIKNNNKLKILIKKSHHVITSSPYNLQYCLEENLYKSATYVPCSLDIKRFKPCNQKTEAKVTIGRTGTFSSQDYLDSIKHIIKKACNEFNLKLILITNFDYQIDDIDMEVISWNKDTEIKDLQRIDIGLYPLIPSEWSLGKGGLKSLQYMSIGIPSIATNFGTAKDIITHEENGFLVDTDEEWLNTISLLADDLNLRDKIGRNARTHIENNYSNESIENLYLDILHS